MPFRFGERSFARRRFRVVCHVPQGAGDAAVAVFVDVSGGAVVDAGRLDVALGPAGAWASSDFLGRTVATYAPGATKRPAMRQVDEQRAPMMVGGAGLAPMEIDAGLVAGHEQAGALMGAGRADGNGWVALPSRVL